MGFQVSFSIKRKHLSLTQGYAGDPQVITCGVGTTLTATVWGSESSTASFLWEQIAGPEVTWLTPLDQLVVSFNKNALPGNSNLDVQFRFWINKGTSVEFYSDVWIYSTPTSFGSVGGSTMNTFISFRNNDQVEFPVSDTSVEIVKSLNNVDYSLRWPEPTNQTSRLQTDVQQFISGEWVTIGITTGNVSEFSPIDPLQPYRVIVSKDHIEPGVISDRTQHYSPVSVYYGDIQTQYSAGVATHSLPTGNSIFNTVYIERTLALLDQTESQGTVGISYASNVNTIYNLVTIERTITGCVPDDTSFGTSSISYANFNTVYNYVVTQLGGVVVGG